MLGRTPTFTELGIVSALWSEHCSYKHSRPLLRRLPTKAPYVLQGPGENAGVISIGDGLAVAFKIESHNHPSAVEPYQGAATGVGGILRDVFTMGARPIALLNSLRFGSLESPRVRYLFAGVVKGIGDYGNCVGVPTVAGELAVTSTAEYIALASTATYTPGTGWTNLGNTGATSSSYQYTADYRTGVGTGVVSETITSSAIGALSAAVATFKPVACTGGTLGLTPPSTVAFPAVTLNGTNQTATAGAGLTPSDMSGSAAGWNVQATSTTFTNGAGRTLPTSVTTVSGAAATAVSGNCDLPTNSIAYPVTLPAGTTAPTAVKVYDAAPGTGGGPLTLTLSFKLAVPASAYMGSYSSTWTFTIASGP